MKKIIVILSFAVIIVGCRNVLKENIYNQLKQDKPLSNQFFYFNSDRDTILKCKYGTDIYIKSNSFCDEFDSSISSNVKITLEVLEFVRLTDMILNKISTLSNDKIIETGGMLNVIGRVDNKLLKLKEGENIKVTFHSKLNTFSSFYCDNKKELFNWSTEQLSIPPQAAVKKDTSLFLGDTTKWTKNNAKLNVLSFNKIGWINCDRFLNFDSTTDIFVKAEGINLDSSTFCSVILKKYNSIIPGKLSLNTSMKFTPLPVDEIVTLFLISYKEGDYYMGIKDVVVKEKETYSVNLKLVSKEQLKEKIEEFDKLRPL